MIYSGWDVSARRIAVVAHEPVLNVVSAQVFTLYKVGAKQTASTLAAALDAMDDFLRWADAIAPAEGQRLAWVENPLVGRGGVATTMKQAYVGGIVRGVLARAGFLVYDVNVSTWKHEVTGNGGASKTDVRLAVSGLWPKAGVLVRDDADLTDAAAVAIYGRRQIEKAVRLRAAEPAEGSLP